MPEAFCVIQQLQQKLFTPAPTEQKAMGDPNPQAPVTPPLPLSLQVGVAAASYCFQNTYHPQLDYSALPGPIMTVPCIKFTLP